MSTTPDPQVTPAPRAGRGRIVAARVLTVLGVLLAALSIVAGYVRWELLDSDTFEETAVELIESEPIRDQVALTLVEQLYRNVDVTAALEERLPSNLQALAAPIAGASRQLADDAAQRLLERPRVQELWTSTLTLTHRQLLDVLEGGGELVSTEGGAVVLDLRPLVVELGDQVAIVGRLAERLPDDTGRIEIIEADQLDTAQTVAQALKVVGTWLWIVAFAVFAAAIWLARGRRRLEVRAIAIGLVIAGLLVLVVRRLAGSYLVDSLTGTDAVRDSAEAAWEILSDRLRHSGWTVLLLALVALVGVWFLGPRPRAAASRRSLAPYLRRADMAYGGYAVALLLLFAFTPVLGWWRPLFTVVVIALGAAGVEVLRRHTAREFPDAHATDVWAGITKRFETLRSAEDVPAPAPAVPVGVELERLGELHTRGVLTDDEFASAKAKLLA